MAITSSNQKVFAGLSTVLGTGDTKMVIKIVSGLKALRTVDRQ